jgi:acetate kinase
VKYQMIDIETETTMASGLVEKIGLDGANVTHKVDGAKHRIDEPIHDHSEALALVTRAFATWGPNLSDAVAVGHRVVHGGQTFREPTIITDAVIEALTQLAGLAPLHNPPAIAGIKAAQQALPGVPHVAIFDTAFFSTLAPEAYTYAIDRELAQKHHIRKYGFHGTSHAYVSATTAQFLGRDPQTINQIVCHLGNGASISAIRGGVAIDTSMGLTPLPGLVMGTRSGDIDPGVFAYLQREAGMDSVAVDTLLNKHSGIAGLADGTSDFRDLWAKIDAGDADASLAMDVYIHRLVLYIGSYLALLGHTDALVFTAGVGENDNRVRARLVERLAGFGVTVDPERNTPHNQVSTIISGDDSTITVLVVPTNEELAMARQTYQVIH